MALKLKAEVAEHWFGSSAIKEALLPSTVTTKERVRIKAMKIKHIDKDKVVRTATVLDITSDEKVSVATDYPTHVVVETIDPKTIVGLFITTLGRELEVSFGVGKVSTSSLIPED